MSTSTLDGAINQWVHKRWWVPVLEGTLLALFGILVLVSTGAVSNRPVGSLVLLFVFLAIFLIAHGLVTFIGALLEKGAPDRMFSLVAGVVFVVMGIVAFVLPKTSLAAFAWLLIVFTLVVAILSIVRALGWRKVPGSRWGWMMTFGILMLVLALYCVIFPVPGTAAISFALLFWIGFLAVMGGVLLMWAGIKVRNVTAQIADRHYV